MSKMLFFASAWEDGEYIVSCSPEDAKPWQDVPIGHTLSPSEAKVIAAWLNEGGAVAVAKYMALLDRQEANNE